MTNARITDETYVVMQKKTQLHRHVKAKTQKLNIAEKRTQTQTVLSIRFMARCVGNTVKNPHEMISDFPL